MDIHKRFVGRRGTSLTAHGGTGASRTYPMLRGPIRYQFYSSPINIPMLAFLGSCRVRSCE